jgi:hypothetical protein
MELILGSFAREIKSPRALDLRYSGAPDVPRASMRESTEARSPSRRQRNCRGSSLVTRPIEVRAALIGALVSSRARDPQADDTRSIAPAACCASGARRPQNVDCVAAAALRKARARAGFHTFVAPTPGRGLDIVN